MTSLVLAALQASAAEPFWPQWKFMPGAGFLTTGGENPDLVFHINGKQLERSTDAGNTFTVLSTPFDSLYLSQLVAVPSRPAVFYAVTDAYPFSAAQIYRSDDSGASWRKIAAPFGGLGPYEWVSQVTADVDPSVLYGVVAFAQGSVESGPACHSVLCPFGGFQPLRSINGGVTWQALGVGTTGRDMKLQPALSSGGRILYVGSKDGVFRSRDAGVTWEKVLAASIEEITVDRLDASTVYARAAEPTQKIWVTDDGGASWRVAPPLDIFSYEHNRELLPDPLVAGRLFLVSDDGWVYETVDRARTWKRLASGRLMSNPRNIVLSMKGDARAIIASELRVETRPDSFALGSALWWNPSESGRGLTITQHAGGKTFVAWYAYDTAGNQVWRVMPDGTWQDQHTLNGALYETRGPDFFGGGFDASRVSVQVAGSATLHFDSDASATFTYRLNDGTLFTTAIVREPLDTSADPDARGDSLSDIWWNADESGWGAAVSQQFLRMFLAWYVYDSAGHPQWVVMPQSLLATDGAALLYTGDIYTTSGPPSTDPFDPSRVVVTKVGSASIRFTSSRLGSWDGAVLGYTAFGRSAQKTLTRQPF